MQLQAISIGNPLVFLVSPGLLSLRKNLYSQSSLSWTATGLANFISCIRIEGTISPALSTL